MPRTSRKDLVAFFRSRGATTWPEIMELVKSLGWRVVLREGAMEVLKGPGGSCVVHTAGKVRKELQALQMRAIAADGEPADAVEPPRRNDEDET